EMVEAHKNCAVKAHAEKNLFLEYPSFLYEFENKILPHFGLEYSEKEVLAAAEIKKYDAKSFQKNLFNSNSIKPCHLCLRFYKHFQFPFWSRKERLTHHLHLSSWRHWA